MESETIDRVGLSIGCMTQKDVDTVRFAVTGVRLRFVLVLSRQV